MARQTFVVRDGKLVEKHLASPLGGASFYVISDCMDGAVHPCTGQMMDSKSEFRRTTRAHGCIEVGDQTHHLGRRDPSADRRESEARKRDIAHAMNNPDRRAARRFRRAYSGDGWN